MDKDSKKIEDQASIKSIVDSLIDHATLEKVPVIHIEPSREETIVRYRIDGDLKRAMTLPASVHSMVVSRIKEMAHLDKKNTEKPQEGEFKTNDSHFRVSTLPTIDGEKIVLNFFPEA